MNMNQYSPFFRPPSSLKALFLHFGQATGPVREGGGEKKRPPKYIKKPICCAVFVSPKKPTPHYSVLHYFFYTYPPLFDIYICFPNSSVTRQSRISKVFFFSFLEREKKSKENWREKKEKKTKKKKKS